MSSQLIQLDGAITASRIAVPQHGLDSNTGSNLLFAGHLDRAGRPESAAHTEPPSSESSQTQAPAHRTEGNPVPSAPSRTRPEASFSNGRAPKATSAQLDRSSQPHEQRQARGTSDATAAQSGATRNTAPYETARAHTATSSPVGPQEAQAVGKNSAAASESSSDAPSANQAAEATPTSGSAPNSEILSAALPLSQVPQIPVQAAVVQTASAAETNDSRSPATPNPASVAAPASANAQASANKQPADQPAEQTPAIASGVTPSFQASANAQPTDQAPPAAPDVRAHDEAPGELTQHETPADNTAAPAAKAEKANGQPELQLPPGLKATASKVSGDPATAPSPEAPQAAEAGDALASRQASTAASSQASQGPVTTVTAGTSAGSSSPSPTFASTSTAPVSSTSNDSSPDSGDSSQGSNSNSSGQDSNRAQPLAASPVFTINTGSAAAPAGVQAAASVVLQTNTGADGAAAKASAAPLESSNFVSQERAFAAWQSTTEQLGRIVNAATLNFAQNGTEMRVQFRTADFGPMELRATLEAGKVGAAISVEDSEAHNALLNQLPALVQSLAERQVQLDHVSVVSSFGHSEAGFGTASQQHHDNPTPSGGYPQQPWESEQQAPEPVYAPATETWLPESPWGRLNVRA